MSTEIQLHEAHMIGKIVRVEYSLVDDNGIANVTQEITVESLIPVLEDYNEYGDFYKMDYLADWLRKIVTAYLERGLAA